MTLTDKQSKFVAALLREAADEFSNHGCNDLSKEQAKMFTDKEWAELCKDFHVYNGDPEEATGKKEPHLMMDWIWMRYFAHLLDK